MYQKVYYLAFVSAVLLEPTFADPTQCYYCPDDNRCNDPVNTSEIQKQNCSTFEPMLLSKNIPTLLSFNTSANFPQQQYLENRSGRTCLRLIGRTDELLLRMSATIASPPRKIATVRGCDYKYYSSKEACSYLEEFYAEVENFTCFSCDTDLCNSSSRESTSLAMCLLLSLWTTIVCIY